MNRHTEAAQEQNAAIDRVVDRFVASPAKTAFEADAEKALATVARSSRYLHARDELTSTEKFAIAQILTKASMGLAVSVGQQLQASTRETLVESLHVLNRYLVAMGKRPFTQTEIDALVLRRLSEQSTRRLRATTSLATNIVMTLQRKVRESQAESMSELLQEIDAALHNEWWKIERTSNTETAQAFNAIRSDAILKRGEWRRWTELVDDATGKPLDDRVGDDSMVLHGQVAKPGQTFIMPPVPQAPWPMVGDEYDAPPNRPNDRAVLLPWERGSGVPAWVWRNGRKVVLR